MKNKINIETSFLLERYKSQLIKIALHGVSLESGMYSHIWEYTETRTERDLLHIIFNKIQWGLLYENIQNELRHYIPEHETIESI